MKTLLLQNKQFLFYCVIGASGVALDFGIYTALVKNNLLVYQAANAAGYGSGTLFSFIFNARFNFCVKDKIALRLASFFGIAFLGWIASAALLNLLIGRYGRPVIAIRWGRQSAHRRTRRRIANNSSPIASG